MRPLGRRPASLLRLGGGTLVLAALRELGHERILRVAALRLGHFHADGLVADYGLAPDERIRVRAGDLREGVVGNAFLHLQELERVAVLQRLQPDLRPAGYLALNAVAVFLLGAEPERRGRDGDNILGARQRCSCLSPRGVSASRGP